MFTIKTPLKLPLNNKGIAIPMVLSCVMLVAILVTEFAVNERMTYDLAMTDYETLRAEYLAKSALNISLLRLKVSKSIKETIKTLGLPNSDEISNMIISIPLIYPIPASLLGGEDSGVENTEGTLDATMSAISGRNLNTILNENIGALVSEKNKSKKPADPNDSINLYSQNLKEFKELITQAFEDKKKNDELFMKKYRNYRLDETLNNIIDWVDKDKDSLNGGAEATYYQKLKEPYEVKNDRFDTLSELHLVRGVNDDIFDIITSIYSIYSDDKIKISDLVKNHLMMRWLSTTPSREGLTEKELTEIEEDFAKPDCDWKADVQAFEEHIRSFRLPFNDKNQQTPQVKLTIGDDINRYKIIANGNFRKNKYTIETIVDRTDEKHMVLLYYNYY